MYVALASLKPPLHQRSCRFTACHTVQDGSHKIFVTISIRLYDPNFEACHMRLTPGESWRYDLHFL